MRMSFKLFLGEGVTSFDEMWEKFLPTSGLGVGEHFVYFNDIVKDWVKRELGGSVGENALESLWSRAKDKITKYIFFNSFRKKLLNPDYDIQALEKDDDPTDKWCEKVELKKNQRLHYSKDANFTLRAMQEQRRHSKPNGLWYACDEGWFNHCNYEMDHRKESLKNRYLLTLDMSKILLLNTKDKVESFSYQYNWEKSEYRRFNEIDWIKVAERYGGVECCPYFRGLRQDYPWYVGLDVPSGCVWDRSAILKIEKV